MRFSAKLCARGGGPAAGVGLGSVRFVPEMGPTFVGSSSGDANAPVMLKGKVTQVEWINPHAWIHLDAVQEDESVVPWMVEGGTPNTLLRAGIDKNTVKIGTEIVKQRVGVVRGQPVEIDHAAFVLNLGNTHLR